MKGPKCKTGHSTTPQSLEKFWQEIGLLHLELVGIIRACSLPFITSVPKDQNVFGATAEHTQQIALRASS